MFVSRVVIVNEAKRKHGMGPNEETAGINTVITQEIVHGQTVDGRRVSLHVSYCCIKKHTHTIKHSSEIAMGT